MESSKASKAGRETSHEWTRVIWLDGEIRRGTYPCRRALEEEFGVSRRTALGTVAFLRHSLGAPLEYSRRHGGYCYTDPTYALPAVFLREGELLALLLAQQVSREYLGTALEPALREVVGGETRSMLEAGGRAGEKEIPTGRKTCSRISTASSGASPRL